MRKLIGFFSLAFFLLTQLSFAANLDKLLIDAAQQGKVNEVHSLLSRGADPNAADEDGKTLTALMLAAREGNAEVVRLLLAAGANVNATAAISVGVSGFSDGLTALMQAAASGDRATVELLLRYKADPNAVSVKMVQDEKGAIRIERTTPLIMRANNSSVLRILVDHGANPGAMDSDGNSVLMHAAQYLNADSLQFLLSKGADPLVKNHEGKCALDFAREAGKVENVRVLEKASQRMSP